MNDAITKHAWREVEHPELLTDVRHGWCLQAVRLIVEDALSLDPMAFYDRWGATRTTQGGDDRTNWSWWAADIEASMKKLGLPVPAENRTPGDLVFSHEAAKPYGHVGLLVRRDLLLEVVNPKFRPSSLARGHVCLTPYGAWRPTLLARLA